MVEYAVFALGGLMILNWLHRRYDEKKAIVRGCEHNKVLTKKTAHDFGDTLYLECQECGWQRHIPRVMPLPDGTYWYMPSHGPEEEHAYMQAFLDRQRAHQYPPSSI